MKQVFPCGDNGTGPSTSAANYNSVSSGMAWTATESDVTGLCPTAGTFKNLVIKLAVAPGSGKSWTFKVRKNGADTALVVTISDAATSGSDTTHSFTVAAGDQIAISATPSGTPSSTSINWNTEFVGDNANEFILMSGSPDQPTRTSDEINSVHNGTATFASIIASNEDPRATLVPSTCTLKALYIKLTASPGTSKSWTFRIRKNAANETSSDVTISGAGTTGNVTGLSIALSAGDYITLMTAPSSIPTATNIQWGVLFTAGTDGESFVSGNSSSASISNNTYNQVNNAGTAWNGTEANRQAIAGTTAFDIKKLNIRLTAAPGASASRIFTVRNNGSSGNNTVTVTGAGVTTGSDTTHTDSFTTSGNTIGILHTLTGLPGGTVANWAVVIYVVGNITTTQTQTGVSRIIATSTKTQTGKARITNTTTKTQTGIARIQKAVTQTTTGTSRITANTTKTQTGVANIRNTTNRTQSGISRIQNTVSQNQTGVSRLAITTVKTQTGVSRVTSTTSQTQSGIADIRKTTTKTQTGLAAIQNTTTQGQGGLARINKSIYQTQDGLSRITATNQQTQSGKSRVTSTSTKTQTGTSRVTATTTQTQSGVANITTSGNTTTIQTTTGISRVEKSVQQTQVGKARITISTTQTQTGVSHVTSTTTKTTDGKASIQKTASQTQVGKARVQVTTPQIQLGKSNISNTTSKTINGKASLATTSTQTQTGKARLSSISTKTQTGVARIRPHLPYQDSYSEQSTSFTDPYTSRGSSFSDLYSNRGSNYRDTYPR